MIWVIIAWLSAKYTLPMPGNAYPCRLASLMPWPFQPDAQPSSTVCSWLATGTAAAVVAVLSGPKMKFAWSCVTHLCTSAAAVAGCDASFSGTSLTWCPSTPPALFTMAAQAVAPSSSSLPSALNGPDVAAISQIVMGELADPPPPPPEEHPAATPARRSAPAAARPRTFSRRATEGTRAGAAPGFLGKKRAVENRESSIKAPFGFMQDCRTGGQQRTLFSGLVRGLGGLSRHKREFDERCIPNA